MKTLLLCGYRTSDNNEDVLGVNPDAQGHIELDRQIEKLTELGFDVVCVVAGGGADEQLRKSRLIANTELVFDTNGNDVTVASNVKAGTAALNGEACFVLPVEIPCPEREVWAFLRNEWGKIGFDTPAAILQAVDQQGAAWRFGFPLLLTRSGSLLIQKSSGLKTLLDTRLKYLHLAYEKDREPRHAESL